MLLKIHRRRSLVEGGEPELVGGKCHHTHLFFCINSLSIHMTFETYYELIKSGTLLANMQVIAYSSFSIQYYALDPRPLDALDQLLWFDA